MRYKKYGWRGGATLGRLTSDQEVVGSIPGSDLRPGHRRDFLRVDFEGFDREFRQRRRQATELEDDAAHVERTCCVTTVGKSITPACLDADSLRYYIWSR